MGIEGDPEACAIKTAGTDAGGGTAVDSAEVGNLATRRQPEEFRAAADHRVRIRVVGIEFVVVVHPGVAVSVVF